MSVTRRSGNGFVSGDTEEEVVLAERIRMCLHEAGHECSTVTVERLDDDTLDVIVLSHLDQPDVPDEALDKALKLACWDNRKDEWLRNGEVEREVLV